MGRARCFWLQPRRAEGPVLAVLAAEHLEPTCGLRPRKHHRPAASSCLCLPGTPELGVQLLQLRGGAPAERGVRPARRLPSRAGAQVTHRGRRADHQVENGLDEARGQAGQAAGERSAHRSAGGGRRLWTARVEGCGHVWRTFCTLCRGPLEKKLSSQKYRQDGCGRIKPGPVKAAALLWASTKEAACRLQERWCCSTPAAGALR